MNHNMREKFINVFLLPSRWEPNYTISSGKASGKEIPIGILVWKKIRIPNSLSLRFPTDNPPLLRLFEKMKGGVICRDIDKKS